MTSGDGAAAESVGVQPENQEIDASLWGEGPASDEEMPLADHIEEMLKRLAIVIAVAGTVSLVTFPFADQLINLLWNSILPEGELTRPRLSCIREAHRAEGR